MKWHKRLLTEDKQQIWIYKNNNWTHTLYKKDLKNLNRIVWDIDDLHLLFNIARIQYIVFVQK